MDSIKKQFALRLAKRLITFYQGKLPSYSKIARDFTLRASNLPPVSHETIRQWLRGDSLPHVSRLNVLSEWLGVDLLNLAEHATKPFDHPKKDFTCSCDYQQSCNLLASLMPDERQVLNHLIQILISRRQVSQ